MSYFIIITNYGFDLTATRAISINKQNKEAVAKIYSSVFIIKFILLLICFFIMLLVVLSFQKFRVDFVVYIVAFLMVIGNVLFPVWFFQGIENMKYITFINIISRSLIALSIFVFVKDHNDYLLALFINTFSYLLPGIIGFVIVRYKYHMVMRIPKKQDLIDLLKEGWHIFVSSFLGNIIASSSIFILGLTSSKEIVGIYSAIEKIIRAVIGFFMPITQALFPYVSSKFAESYSVGLNVVKKAGKYILLMALTVLIIVLLFSKEILGIIYPNDIVEYNNILKLLGFWFFVSILNNIIGYQYLVASGQEKTYSKAFVIAAVVTIALYVLLSGPFSAYGIVSAMLIGESVLTVGMLFLASRIGHEGRSNK